MTTTTSNIPAYEPAEGLDPDIIDIVNLLRAHGVETFESCQGGDGHAFLEPTVRFHGGDGAGFHALGVALTHGLPVTALRQYWDVYDNKPHGPHWEMVFLKPSPPV